jgi:O-antigen/teichoic acid export membrane protein
MQGAPVILGLYYSMAAAGLYFLVQRLMAAPLALVGQSVAQVLTAELGRRLSQNEGGCLRLFIKSSGGLLLIGGIPITLVGVFGEDVLPWLLGPEWKQAGAYLLALTPFFVGQFVMSPLANFLNILGRQGALLLWDGLRLVVALPGLILPGLFWDWEAEQSLWLFSALMALFYAGLWLLLFSCLRSRAR